jgi:hypothetical protein
MSVTASRWTGCGIGTARRRHGPGATTPRTAPNQVSIHTSPRAKAREHRAGGPLDGLVNLFDLGIVLAVAFLLAALSSLKLTGVLINHKGPQANQPNAITVNKNQTTHPLRLKANQRIVGHGTPAGTVYRLNNGQLIYVAPKGR